MAKLKKGPKFVLVFLAVGILLYGAYWISENTDLVPGPNSGGRPTSTSAPSRSGVGDVTPINVCVVTWGGYAGGQYFNGGFNSSTDSRYYQDYGILVNFVLNDDPDSSLAAWKAGDCDLHWWTIDSFTTLAAGLVQEGFDPVFEWQSDWSRGGDVVVAVGGVNNVGDLRGRRIAYAAGTPSHTMLLQMLDANDMTPRDIVPVEVSSAIDAAAAFKAGEVDAAVVWSPDDEDCLANVPRSKRLITTREMRHVIADGFFAHKGWADNNQEELRALIEGWMIGAAEINTNDSARREAARILADGTGMPEDWTYNAIGNVRLTTFGDNRQFFNLDGRSSGITAEQLYNDSGRLFQRHTNLISGRLPAWRAISDTRALRSINLGGRGHEAETSQSFTPASSDVATAEAFSTKELSVSFATGSAELDENGKSLIDLGFVPTARSFSGVRIRVEGNTDNTGSLSVNLALSERRAQSVVDYLVSEHGFDPNRFIVIGNGPNKPVADNSTEAGRAQNRRTDFELIVQ